MISLLYIFHILVTRSKNPKQTYKTMSIEVNKIFLKLEIDECTYIRFLY